MLTLLLIVHKTGFLLRETLLNRNIIIYHDTAAENVRRSITSITPLISSAEGVIHKDYASLHKRLCKILARKWSTPYSQLMEWARVKSRLSIIRAVSVSFGAVLSDTFTRNAEEIKKIPFEDGAALP